ncbi:hypothetical protein GCM10025868_31050 [Angustibacter aerolatus]|uniref:NADH-ubiquinone oxidoreductase ferredoxin-like domain-containing protein n=1 Tax=Angustibacter aerolatus TaxID=1162965 RepID=A0ABQ6JI00_9ACTN|nr:hypothetical protein GCM10025868_31050 [Angustibacter aerolatus]
MPGPDGSLRPMPKPQASCTMTVTEGMQVRTQRTSPVADKAQQGVMEPAAHQPPARLPGVRQGRRVPLQNQALSNGRSESRFEDVKRTYPKPIAISTQVLLDRERCVLCARCTRFSDQIAGDPFISLVERGALQQIGIYEKQPFQSLLQRQHGADLPGRRAHRCGLPLPVPSVRPGLDVERLRALRVRLLAAHRHPPRPGAAPARR